MLIYFVFHLVMFKDIFVKKVILFVFCAQLHILITKKHITIYFYFFKVHQKPFFLSDICVQLGVYKILTPQPRSKVCGKEYKVGEGKIKAVKRNINEKDKLGKLCHLLLDIMAIGKNIINWEQGWGSENLCGKKVLKIWRLGRISSCRELYKLLVPSQLWPESAEVLSEVATDGNSAEDIDTIVEMMVN